jgi:hypothetical protein
MIVKLENKMDPVERFLRGVLPDLGTQERGTQIMFYAHLRATNGNWNCYLSEGSEENGKFVVRGWFIGVATAWQKLPLETLLAEMRHQGISIKEDLNFVPTTYAALCDEPLSRSA